MTSRVARSARATFSFGRIATCAITGALAAACSTTDLVEERTGVAAEAMVTETTGPFATISVFPDATFGDFFAEGTILRDTSVSACVGRIRSVREQRSLSGEMTLKSGFLAQTGARSSTVVLRQDFDNEYVYFGPPLVYPRDRSVLVRLESTGGDGIPALPRTDLRSAPFPFLEVTQPVIPASDLFVIPSDRDFEVVWRPPPQGSTCGAADEGCATGNDARVVVSLWFIAGFELDGEIRCGFPVSAGRGAMPATLLHEVRQRVSPDAPELAIINVFVGDQREVQPDGASYVFELGPFDSTTIGTQFVALD